MPSDWEAIIGLECHAQLRTESKMFCACPVVQDAPPNTAICPICMGHPGTLPSLNDRAVKLGVRAALALGCALATTSIFARKHYFYPDLPKGYQISQFDRPLATGGSVHVGDRAIRLTRIHLEEDAGKMVHGEGHSEVDYNRAGVPLIEIVSEAELRDADEAEAYLRVLHRVLVASGICTGDMEKGHFRCDANVSVHRPGEAWGAKVEVKNVNSFRFVARAIRGEVERQITLLKAGQTVDQETRTWAGGRTVLLRKKEGSADYRYFPEPDLLPLVLGEDEIAEERAALVGIPMDLFLASADERRRADWVERYSLPAYDVGVLLGNEEAAAFFVACVEAGGEPRAMSNLVASEVLRRGGAGRLTSAEVVALQESLEAGTLHREALRQAIDALWTDGGRASEVVARLGLGAAVTAEALETMVAAVLREFPAEVADYRAGNKGIIGFLMGRVMAATKRKADPAEAQRVLRRALDGAP